MSGVSPREFSSLLYRLLDSENLKGPKIKSPRKSISSVLMNVPKLIQASPNVIDCPNGDQDRRKFVFWLIRKIFAIWNDKELVELESLCHDIMGTVVRVLQMRSTDTFVDVAEELFRIAQGTGKYDGVWLSLTLFSFQALIPESILFKVCLPRAKSTPSRLLLFLLLNRTNMTHPSFLTMPSSWKKFSAKFF